MRLLAAGLLLAPLACAAPRTDDSGAPTADVGADLPIARAPYENIEANWKHRLDQPYVYVELRGSYTRIGAGLGELVREMQAQGVEPNGPPFALYYDDPAKVPAEELRARACFPVAAALAPEEPLHYEVLPQETVVYGFVAGPYPEVPRAYPGLFAFLAKMRWRESGPIREIYLVNPADVTSFDQLVTEVQIPATSAR